MIKSLKYKIFGNKSIHTIAFGIGKGIRLILNPAYESRKIAGIYEQEISRYFKRFATDANIFFDIGAYDGYYSLIYKKFNPNGNVYLCEPGMNAGEKINRNFQLNDHEANSFALINSLIGNKISKRYTTIDEIFKDSNQQIFFKIDVEGAEEAVLSGGKSTFAANNCRFIIETHSLELEQKCINFLSRRNYKTQIIHPYFTRKWFKSGRNLTHNRWLIAFS